jgi:uncharacterized membrane protein
MLTNRRRVAEVASEAVENISPYVDQFAHDEKFRRRLIAAIGAAAAARRRAKRQAGWLGLAAGLSSDPVLRAQVAQAVVQLQKAKNRKSRRKHTMRNATLIIGGSALVVAAVPELRVSVVDKLDRLKRRARDGSRAGTTATIVEDIEVGAPVSVVYNQWTQFEEFPTFMEGIDEVKQLDDTLIHWAASIAGKKAEWDAKIIQQEPDKRITWESIDGMNTRGTVSFEQADSPERTRIRLRMTYTPGGAADVVGSAIGLDEYRVRGDLERFRELIEERQSETGAWRGTIKDGKAKTIDSRPRDPRNA